MTLSYRMKDDFQTSDRVDISLDEKGEICFEADGYGYTAMICHQTTEEEGKLWKALLEGLNRHGDPTEAEPPLDATPAEPMGERG